MKFSTKAAITIFSVMGLAVCTPVSFAQEGENLVPNGSFESIGKKPKRLGKIESATGWVSPTGVRADLFVDSKIEDISVPLNVFGKEDAREGENYIGLVGFSYGDKMPRSYAMTKMDSPMKKGMKYCVKMYVSLSEASKYASNNMGVHFSKKMLGTDSKVSIIVEPSILHYQNEYETVSARYNWTEICGVYTAKGGEKYIALGNFDSNEDTKSERMKKDKRSKDIKVAQVIAAYYYVDDVSVRLINDEKGEECDCALEDAGESYSTMIYQKVFNETEDMTSQEHAEMQQVFFAFGKSALTTEATQSLDIVVEYMKANPGVQVQLKGHCNTLEDEVGAEKSIYADMDNKRLGAVMKYLMEKGVSESSMMPSRQRDDVPNTEEHLESDDDEMKQAKNRRVTFKFIK